jgi:hypothetical protein
MNGARDGWITLFSILETNSKEKICLLLKVQMNIKCIYTEGVRLSSYHRANNVSFPLTQMNKKKVQ